MKSKLILLSIVPVTVAALAFAGTALATHQWGTYHWARTANPFPLKLGDNVSAAWDSTLVAASADWSQSTVLDTTIVAGQTKGNCQPTKGRVEVCNKTYGNNGWLGVASIWASGSHITQGTVKLNDTYFNTPTYNTPGWRQFVACQEVGHTFGLDHQDVNFDNANLGTCMDYTNDPTRNDGAGNNLQPNKHDYDELGIIYNHLDSLTTLLASAPSHGNAAAGAQDSAEFGTVLRQDAKGRPALYGRDLGKGEKVFTFVYWAE